MKNKFTFNLFGTLLSVLLLASSCKKDNDDNTPTPKTDTTVVNPYYSLGIQMKDYTNYLLSTDSIKTGSITPVGNGVEIPANEFIQSEQYFYYFSRNDKKFFQYELKADGSVAEKASLLVTQYISSRAYSQNLIDKNTILVMDPVQWGQPAVKWFTISLPDFTVKASGTINLPTFEKAPSVNWNVNVGKAALHGNKIVMGTVYYDFDGNYAAGSHAITIDYPSMTNPTLIESKRETGELSYTNNLMAKTSNGDLYLGFSRGVNAPKSDNGVYSYVLRIKNGQTTFDDSYFLNLTSKMGEPTQLIQLDYLEGESAMAMLFNPTNVSADLSNYDADHYYFAKIDLGTQTVNKFNVPKANVRLARKPLVDNGKFITYHKSLANNTTNVLEIDYNGGANAFTIGKKIEGDGVTGYSVVKHPTPAK